MDDYDLLAGFAVAIVGVPVAIVLVAAHLWGAV